MNPAPPGHAPLHYLPPQYSMPPKAGGGFGRGLIGWILFVALAAALFVTLSRKSSPEYTEVPLSEFYRLLREDKIEHVTIRADEVRGKLTGEMLLPGAARARKKTIFYRATLPAEMGTNWAFTQWVLENAKGAKVESDGGGSLIMGVIVPLIPWLLIFGFIWFFVFRQLRSQGVRGQQPTPVYVVNPAGLPGALGAGAAPAPPVPPATPPQPPGA